MNKPITRVDRLYTKIKNNPVMAFLIGIGTIVIALSTFTNATKNILGTVIKDTRPPINGEWKAEVTYDWDNAKYIETFVFEGEGSDVYGTATFLQGKKGIVEGEMVKNSLKFNTNSHEVLASFEPKDSIHHYRGKYMDGKINFTMQTEGGYSDHILIRFIAKKVVQ